MGTYNDADYVFASDDVSLAQAKTEVCTEADTQVVHRSMLGGHGNVKLLIEAVDEINLSQMGVKGESSTDQRLLEEGICYRADSDLQDSLAASGLCICIETSKFQLTYSRLSFSPQLFCGTGDSMSHSARLIRYHMKEQARSLSPYQALYFWLNSPA